MSGHETSRLSRLKAGKNNFKVIKYPGTDEKAGMALLSLDESQDAVIAADLYLAEAGIKFDTFTAEIYSDEVNTQLLFRILREHDDHKRPYASSVDEIRKHVTKAEKDALIEEYNQFERDCSPRLADITEEELDSLLSEVKKSPETLNFLDTPTLKRLITFSAGRPAK